MKRTQKLMTATLRRKLPSLYAQDGKGAETTVFAKFFHMGSQATWYVTEFDGDDTFFGVVTLGHGFEWGYFSLAELESLPMYIGGRPLAIQGVERDTFRPRPIVEVSDLEGFCERMGYTTHAPQPTPQPEAKQQDLCLNSQLSLF